MKSESQRECATITTRMGISLPNAHMRGKRKIMRRERNLTKAIRKIINSQRRSPMVKLMLVKNGTQVMRVLSQKASSSKSLFPNLPKHTCLMAKESKKKVKSKASPSPKYVTSDEDTLSSDNYDSSDDDNPLPSELVKILML
jgi:hypothetical protein